MSCSGAMHGPSASLHAVAAWSARTTSKRSRELVRPLGDAVGLKLFAQPETATSQRHVLTTASAGFRTQFEDLIQRQRQAATAAVETAVRDKSLALVQKPDIHSAFEASFWKNPRGSPGSNNSTAREEAKPLPPYSAGCQLGLEHSAAFHFVHPITASAIKVPVAAEFYLKELRDAGYFRPLPGQVEEDDAAEDAEEAIRKTYVHTGSLCLRSAAASVPHPEKEFKGGEDAHFVYGEGQAIGVADGVGGWANVGVDAGIYARELMTRTRDALRDGAPAASCDPLEALSRAHAETCCQGSATACVLVLNDDALSAVNVGDSAFMVIRDDRIVFKSPVQQHRFNFPFQLARSRGDPITSAETFTLKALPGDIVVMGTDGLFDNVFDFELLNIVNNSKRGEYPPLEIANRLASCARARGEDTQRHSPFAKAAMDAGILYTGGKLDDITVVVSFVCTKHEISVND